MSARNRAAQLVHDNPGITTEEVGDELRAYQRNNVRQALHDLARRGVIEQGGGCRGRCAGRCRGRCSSWRWSR